MKQNIEKEEKKIADENDDKINRCISKVVREMRPEGGEYDYYCNLLLQLHHMTKKKK